VSGLDLAGVATPELERMLRALERGDFGERFDAVGLRSCGFAAQVGVMRPLLGLAPNAVAIAFELVLAERHRNAHRQPPELVFTRTGTTSSAARDTWAVFSELCGLAQREVFIAGYTFTVGEMVLAPLHQAMVERGVRARIVLDCSQVHVEGDSVEALGATVSTFLEKNWKTFGEPTPELFYDPRTCERSWDERWRRWGATHSMHAKCLAVDDTHALVGSANFTRRAMQDNIEVGVVVHEQAFVRKLLGQWEDAISERIIVAVAG
jgi:putative cardiolipin synthase